MVGSNGDKAKIKTEEHQRKPVNLLPVQNSFILLAGLFIKLGLIRLKHQLKMCSIYFCINHNILKCYKKRLSELYKYKLYLNTKQGSSIFIVNDDTVWDKEFDRV